MAPLQNVSGSLANLSSNRAVKNPLTCGQTTHSIPHAEFYEVAHGEQQHFLLIGTADSSITVQILGPSLWWALLPIWSAACLPGKWADRWSHVNTTHLAQTAIPAFDPCVPPNFTHLHLN